MNAVADPRHLQTVTDPAGAVMTLAVVTIVWLVVVIGFYVWYAIALSRLFPRLGEESWKGWVPVLNEATILTLGGKPAWNVIFYFIPIVNLYGVYLKVIATHRINERFGRGAGSTVLALLLPPVWATLLAWGAPPYPEGDRLAHLQPGPRRQPQPGADAAHGAPQGYLAPPIMPPGGQAPQAQAGPASFAPASFAPASFAPEGSGSGSAHGGVPAPVFGHPAADPHAFGSPTGGQFTAPASGAGAGPTYAPDQLIDSVPGVGGHTAAPPAPAPTAAPAESDPVQAEPAQAAPAQAPLAQPATYPQATPTAAPVASPASAEPAPLPQASTPLAPAQPSPAQPSPAQLEADLAALETVRTPPTRERPAAEAAAETAAETPASAVFSAPPVLRGPGLGARAERAPGIRPAPGAAPAAGVFAPATPAPASALSQPSGSDAVEEDEFDATVVVSRRRGVRRVLVLDDGRTFALSATSIVIGRNPDGDPGEQRLSIPDKTRTLSKTHARLVVQGDEWRLTDLHSTNGVVVVADDGAETLLDPGESVIGAGRFVLGEVGMHVEVESGS